MKTFTNVAAAALATTVMLMGCSKSGSDSGSTSSKPSLADVSNTSKVIEDVKKKAAEEAPKADKATPLEAYRKLDSGRPLMFTYLAISGMPVDMDSVASALSQEYRYTSDEFKKRDIATALKPGIDKEVADAKGNRYYYMLVRSTLDKYKFETKSFPLGGSVGSDAYYSFNDTSGYTLAWNNAPKFAEARVEDEAVARQIEGLRTQYDGVSYKVYFFISDVELGTKKLRAEITKVQMLDKRGSVLTEI